MYSQPTDKQMRNFMFLICKVTETNQMIFEACLQFIMLYFFHHWYSLWFAKRWEFWAKSFALMSVLRSAAYCVQWLLMRGFRYFIGRAPMLTRIFLLLSWRSKNILRSNVHPSEWSWITRTKTSFFQKAKVI